MNSPAGRSDSAGEVRAEDVLDEGEAFDRLRLLRSQGVGPVAFRQLLLRFGSAGEALAALPDIAGSGGRRWHAAPPARIEAELRAVRAMGAFHLHAGTRGWPALLAEAEGAPPILIARGNPEIAARAPVAVVGARNASASACRIARGMAAALAEAGHAVVSGLARGIDGAAHRGALAAGPGAAGTIAVVANGLDVTFPPEHAALQDEIAETGLLLSEYPPGTEPLARQFPARNRIIAGLALGTVVAEAAPRSGSLLTARLAGELGREVMAVPGSPLDPRARGCNGLIREGATLVQDAADVIEAIGGFAAMPGPPPQRMAVTAGRRSPRAAPSMARAEARAGGGDLLCLIGHAPVSIDELVRASGLAAGLVQQALVELELAGVLERHAGGRVSRKG